MQIKTIAGATLAALGGLALVGVIAANPFSTQASTGDAPDATRTQPISQPRADTVTPSQVAQPEGLGNLQASEGEEEETKPGIGVLIAPLDDGSIKVLRVVEDGPAAGVLMAGDVITAVGGTVVTEVGDLTGAIADGGVGSTITLTIMRSDVSQDVNVTVGEIDADTYRHKARGSFDFDRGGRSVQSDMRDRFARSEIVIADEDGNYQTRRTMVGAVSNIDTGAGTFTLQPKDGSAPIDYTIDDETRVAINRQGDIGSLNSTDETLVMDVDGKVTLVHQSDRVRPFKRGFHLGKMDRERWPSRSFGDMRGFYSEPGMSNPGRIIDSILERIEQDVDGQAFGPRGGKLRDWIRIYGSDDGDHDDNDEM